MINTIKKHCSYDINGHILVSRPRNTLKISIRKPTAQELVDSTPQGNLSRPEALNRSREAFKQADEPDVDDIIEAQIKEGSRL